MRDTKRLISYRDISEKTRIGRVWSKQDHRICRPAFTSTVFWIGLSKSIWNFWIMTDLIIKFFWMIKVCWKIARRWDGDDTGSQRDVTLEVPSAWETPGGSDSVTATYWLNHIVPLLIKKVSSLLGQSKHIETSAENQGGDVSDLKKTHAAQEHKMLQNHM